MMQLEIAKMNAEAKIRKDDEERDARIRVEIMHAQYECKNRKSRTDEKTAIKQPLLNAILFLNKNIEELRDKYVTNCKSCGEYMKCTACMCIFSNCICCCQKES